MFGAALIVATLQAVAHPVDEYRLDGAALASVVDIRAAVSGLELPAALEVARSVEASSVLGGWSTVCDPFGDIVDVAVGPSGRVFVLDRELMVVHQADSGVRTCLASFGREGEGPGLFRSPKAVRAGADGRVHVLDFDGSIEVFVATRGGRGYVLERTVQTGINAFSFCLGEGGYVVHGYRGDDSSEVVHEVSWDGAIARSLGRMYAGPSNRVSALIAQGRVGCLSGARIAHAASSTLGEVRSYGPMTDEVQWLTRLDGHLPLHLTSHGDELEASMPEEGYDRVASFTETPDGDLLLQLAHLELPVGRTFVPPPTVYSVLIDPTSGDARALGVDLPLILAWGPDFAVTLYDRFQRSLGIVPIR